MLMVNTEMDFLEIRLNALYDYVDYFIIVESSRSFQGNKKPTVLKEHWNRFRRYHDKMIYHELVFPATFNPHRAWDYEDLQRDAPFDQVLLSLEGQRAPNNKDVLIVADMDEIPRPRSLLVLRYCDFPRRLTLASNSYMLDQSGSTLKRPTTRDPEPSNPLIYGMEMVGSAHYAS
ncbi:hypothetical protein ACHAP7_012173 [Fusarium lateritium]